MMSRVALPIFFLLFHGTVSFAQMHLEQGDDVTLTNSGYLRIGKLNGLNIAFDVNEIQAKNNGAASPLFFNLEGGIVQFGRDTQSGDFYIKKFSQSGDRTLWANNDGKISNEKRLKRVYYPAALWQSKDSEKDFEYTNGYGIRAKNNQDDTGLIMPIMLPVGSEISTIRIAVSDDNGRNLKFSLYIDDHTPGLASTNSDVRDFSPYFPCGAPCFTEASYLTIPDIEILNDRVYYLNVINLPGKSWQHWTRVASVLVEYYEP